MSDVDKKDQFDVEFDHRDYESVYHPQERWAKLRAGPALAHTDAHGGFYVASRYQEVCAIARDQQIFSSFLRQTTIPQLTTPPFPPINFDQPEHRRYRVIVEPFFSPAAIRAHEPWIRELAQTYVDRLLASDGFNMPQDLGIPITRDVVFHIMGILDPPDEMKQWADELIFAQSAEAGANMMGFLAGEVQKRRECPGTDFMSGLLTAKFEDRFLTDEEILLTSMLVALAGLDTTNSALSGSVWYLVQNPQKLEELASASDATWKLAMDELVRWTSPAPAQARTARSDTEVSGCPMKGGEMVLLLFGAANRDETVFENPDEVIFGRSPNYHVGFGHGPHRCIGMHLAKLEMQIVLKALVKGLGNFYLAEPDKVEWSGASIRGITSLPLVRKQGK